jgi:hypothetical protein
MIGRLAGVTVRTLPVLRTALLTAAALVVSATPAYAAVQSAPDSVQNRHRGFPLHCRGGEQLAFDTLGPVTDTSTKVGLSLRFTAGPRAAGEKGEGLEPSRCAWVDRPLNDAEPLLVRFTVGIGASLPRVTLRDTMLYWSFLAHNTDSGYFRGVGYRLWWSDDAAAAGRPRMDDPAALSQGSESTGFRFEFRHLPLYAIGWTLIVWVPVMTLVAARNGWRRLAAHYPSRPAHGGRRFRCSLVMRITRYRGGVRLTADDSHLHFSVVPLFRPGHPPFSVPWTDVTASRDGWPWFPFKGLPVMRLTPAKEPGIRILVRMSVGEGIIAASGGRLQLSQPAPAAVGNQLARK